jgi:CRP-like cAMP-binding protein
MDSRPLASAYSGGNAILDRLSPLEREVLLPNLRIYGDEEASVLRTRDQPLDTVYFPIDAVYSIVVELARGNMYEVDVIGRAGVIGAEIAIGARVASRTVLCQAAGRVACAPSDQFKTALEHNRTFLLAVRESLRRQWFDSQQTVACNFAHPIEQRAARWILMTRDQVGQDSFSMRAEFLSIMLGVSEAMVGEILAALVRLDCIQYQDERVAVLSANALREHVCECYDRLQTARFITDDR